MTRLRMFIWLAFHAGSESLPMAAYYWLQQAMIEAKRLNDARAIYHIERATAMIQRHPGYRELV